MIYQEYIDLGFERIDTNDWIEFQNSGYYGFILTKKITDRITIEVTSCSLKEPVMYIKKKNDCTSHRVLLTGEEVKDMI